MRNKVYLTQEGYIEIEVVGDQTDQSVKEMGEEISALIAKLKHKKRPVLVLDNLKAMGDTTPEARREVARLAKSLGFDRTAMLGRSGAMMRYGTNLMLRAIGRHNIRYFSSRDGALLWLGIEPK